MSDQAQTAIEDDTYPVRPENYLCPEFAREEARGLWSRVWQMACREEEIPKVGDYHTYDILNDSVIVIRTAADEIKAFHNVCPHRGRTLTQGCGHANRLVCPFHAWSWKIDGTISSVVDRSDWPEEQLLAEDLNLKPVRSARWGGWVYINLDPDCIGFEEHLAPAKAYLDPFDLGTLNYHWRKSTIFDCNWKVALEAFNEGYHVQGTHSQMLRYFDDQTQNYTRGIHSHYGYWESLPMGTRSPRLAGGGETQDLRLGIREYMEDMAVTLNSGGAVQAVHAARRLEQELAPDTPQQEVLMKFGQFTREYATGRGAQLPEVTPEQQYAVGISWHLFPNQIILPAATGLLGYRARPFGDDPNKCIWDVYSLQRYAPGTAPTVKHEWSQDHGDVDFWGLILTQDYANMGEVQKGMRSRVFEKSRPNPKQEIGLMNFHRNLRRFIKKGYAL